MDNLVEQEIIPNYDTFNELWDANDSLAWFDPPPIILAIKYEQGFFFTERSVKALSLIVQLPRFQGAKSFDYICEAYDFFQMDYSTKYVILEGDSKGIYNSMQSMVDANQGKIPTNYFATSDEEDLAFYSQKIFN
jgi:hypothetical protein